MDVRAPSPVAPPSPLPITSYILKIEQNDQSMGSEEESNPLEQEDVGSQDSEEDRDHKMMEPQKEFIMMFKSLQLLWDPRNPFYTNKYKRRKALGQLVPILRKMKPGANIEDVKKKINSLRTNYRRHWKNARADGDRSDVYKPTIWYYPYLDFLRKLEERPSRENDSPSEAGNSQIQIESQIPEVDNSLLTVRTSKSPAPRTGLRKRKIHKQIINTPPVDIVQNLPDEPVSRESCPQKNISNHVVLEWAETLEKLDPLQRLYAKKAINDVLFEAELGNLHKHSVKINEPNLNDPSTSFAAHSSAITSPTQSSSWQ